MDKPAFSLMCLSGYLLASLVDSGTIMLVNAASLLYFWGLFTGSFMVRLSFWFRGFVNLSEQLAAMRSYWAVFFVAHAAASECALDGGDCASKTRHVEEEGGAMLQSLHAIQRHQSTSTKESGQSGALQSLLQDAINLARSKTKGVIDDELVDSLEASVNQTMMETLFALVVSDAEELWNISKSWNATVLEQTKIDTSLDASADAQAKAGGKTEDLKQGALSMYDTCMARVTGVQGAWQLPIGQPACGKDDLAADASAFNANTKACADDYAAKHLAYLNAVVKCHGEVNTTKQLWEAFKTERSTFDAQLCHDIKNSMTACFSYNSAFAVAEGQFKAKVDAIADATPGRREEYEAIVQTRCILRLLKNDNVTADQFPAEITGCLSQIINTEHVVIKTPGQPTAAECPVAADFWPLAESLLKWNTIIDPTKDLAKKFEMTESVAGSKMAFEGDPEGKICH